MRVTAKEHLELQAKVEGAPHPFHPITRRQAEVLRMVRDFIQRMGHPPTFKDVMRKMGFKSSNAVSDHFKCLEAKGYIRRGYGARALVVIKEPPNETPE